MYHRETELLFPMRVASSLREMRGDIWKDLVDRACIAEAASTDRLAFNLLIIRLCNCLSCQTHSYRALHGCEQCAKQSVRRFRGEDTELVQQFEDAVADINIHINNQINHRYQILPKG
jgi:hypothetical protein